MFKKAIAVLACVAAYAAPASAAIDNAGFEAGNTSSWSSAPTLTAETSYSASWVDGTGATTASLITPVSGNYFGLWIPGAAPTTSSTGAVVQNWSAWNFGTAVTTNDDMLWLRLVTNDWYAALPCAVGQDPATCGFNDSVEVGFTTSGGYNIVQASATSGPDSGWLGFAVPLGATGLQVNIADYYSVLNNTDPGAGLPVVALDYGPSPVPEPSTIMMMLAGLGALGLKGRRRMAAKAE